MNCTKVIPPLKIFVDFYYYYSFFTLFLSLLITPLQFYIILTKSKILKSFKWLILNHSFWCIVVQTFFTSVKPFYLAPAVAGFPIGLFRNGTRITTILGMIGLAFVFMMQFSALAVTFINRYLFVFPSKLINLINKKLIIFGFVVYCIITTTACLYATYPYIFIETSINYKAAEEFDPCLKMYFNEPAFVFFSISKTILYYFFLIFLFGCFCLFVIIFLLSFFIYRVFFHEAASIIKLQKSLILSVVVQVCISLAFLCFPIFGYVIIISFEISHIFVSNLTQLGCCAISSHSLFESLATLYFVAPYKKAVKKILGQIFPYFKEKILPVKSVQISHVSSNMFSTLKHAKLS